MNLDIRKRTQRNRKSRHNKTAKAGSKKNVLSLPLPLPLSLQEIPKTPPIRKFPKKLVQTPAFPVKHKTR